MQYLFNNFPAILLLFGQHLRLTLITLVFALLIALPLGYLISRVRWLHSPVMGLLGLIYTVPSLSMFVLLIPLFGLGLVPAVVALVAYTQFGLTRNWTLGLTSIDPAVIEAANGMGMNAWQRLWRVELPLALPLLLAGIRLAVITTIGIGTVAAFINAGGLGTLLFEGVITANTQKILAGGLVISLFAVAANYGLRLIEWVTERRIRD